MRCNGGPLREPVMRRRRLLPLALCCMTFAAIAADDEQAVRAADARYWQAYNACDLRKMGDLLTDDVEFYHDKTGLTASKSAVLDSLRKGPCADPASHLRREAVDVSIRFHPLAGGFALLSGTHRFHVRKTGEAERLDGQAEFTNVWQSVDGQWRMRRILSYAHGPVPYVPPSTHITLPAATLAAHAGRYRGEHVGDIVVTAEPDGLLLTAGELVVHLRAESPDRYFALERDLRFEFASDDARPAKLTVYERGAVVETAARVD
jgi:ketosteroid isomerase-like protein